MTSSKLQHVPPNQLVVICYSFIDPFMLDGLLVRV